jgi:hypothetical protein
LSVRSKTLDIFEELLLQDLVDQACKAQTATDFFQHVMHLSQKRLANSQLQAALDYINPPFAMMMPCTGPEHIRVQCQILQCLALHFKGHTGLVSEQVYKGLDTLDPDSVTLLRALPQIFVDQKPLLSRALMIVCANMQHKPTTPDIVSSLIEGQAEVNSIDSDSGDSLLHMSALRDHFVVVELLLKAKADLAQKDRTGRQFFSLLHPQDLGHFRSIWTGAAGGSLAKPITAAETMPRSPSSGNMPGKSPTTGSATGAGSLIATPLGKSKGPNTFTLTRMHNSTRPRTALLRTDAARQLHSPGFRLRIHTITGELKKIQDCFLQMGMRRATDSIDKETKTSFVNLAECVIEGDRTMLVGFETFFEDWPEGHSLMLYIHQSTVPLKKGTLFRKPTSITYVARFTAGRPVLPFEVTRATMPCKDTQNSGLGIYFDVREVTFNPNSGN